MNSLNWWAKRNESSKFEISKRSREIRKMADFKYVRNSRRGQDVNQRIVRIFVQGGDGDLFAGVR